MGTFAIAMCLGVGLAAFGGGMGQGRAAGSALEGICRNPNAADKVFTPFILGLAFIESLVIFTFVTAFLVYGWKV
jgi:F-type H+-transporting ATPase subunit c